MGLNCSLYTVLLICVCAPRNCDADCYHPETKPGSRCSFPDDVITVPVNSIVTYTCSDGFVIFGDDSRKCQANGSWSGKSPVCAMNVIENNNTITIDDDKYEVSECTTETIHKCPLFSHAKVVVQLYSDYLINVVEIDLFGDGSVAILDGNGFPIIQDDSTVSFVFEKGYVSSLLTAFIDSKYLRVPVRMKGIRVYSSSGYSSKQCPTLRKNTTMKIHVLGRMCYYFSVGEKLSFHEANQSCSPGRLVHISSSNIQEFLENNLDSEVFYYWIGLQRKENKTQWMDGSNVVPDEFWSKYSSLDGADCVALRKYANYKWAFRNCSCVNAWICQAAIESYSFPKDSSYSSANTLTPEVLDELPTTDNEHYAGVNVTEISQLSSTAYMDEDFPVVEISSQASDKETTFTSLETTEVLVGTIVGACLLLIVTASIVLLVRRHKTKAEEPVSGESVYQEIDTIYYKKGNPQNPRKVSEVNVVYAIPLTPNRSEDVDDSKHIYQVPLYSRMNSVVDEEDGLVMNDMYGKSSCDYLMDNRVASVARNVRLPNYEKLDSVEVENSMYESVK